MNQQVLLHVIQLDTDGNPMEDRNGRAIRYAVPSVARVKYSAERVFRSNGEETTATLEVSLPPETIVYDGDVVEWVDHFGKVVKEPVAAMKEFSNFRGDTVYFRKVWTARKAWSE